MLYEIDEKIIQCPYCKLIYRLTGLVTDNFECNCGKEFSI